MIIIKLKGGLGNQLFQYAFGRFLSQKNNDIFKLDIEGLEKTSKDTQRSFLLDKFNTKIEIAEKKEVLKIKYPLGIFSKCIRYCKAKIFRKFHIYFEPNLLSLKGNLYLDGFFQSERYFKPIEHILRKEFTPKNPISIPAQKFANQIKNNSYSTSIHVRRGDYVSNPSVNKHHGTCNLDYYKNAISKIKEDILFPTFFVFSDDINWVKNNLKLDDAIYVSNQNITDFEELLLMSYCHHNIIANSTFSWWGAWLNQDKSKIVIAPKWWTRKQTSNEFGIIPETWIQM